MIRKLVYVCVALLGVGISVFYDKLSEVRRSLVEADKKLAAYEDLLLSPHPGDTREDPRDILACPICGGESVDFPGDFCTNHRHDVDSRSEYMVEEKYDNEKSPPRSEIDMQSACNSGETVVVKKQDFVRDVVKASTRAVSALRKCGFVYLDSLYDPDTIKEWKRAYDEFASSERSEHFRYPCQGVGRKELMLPFESPFNDTRIYGDAFLRGVLSHAFKGAYKMELQTVITSSVGSGNQRWHQGWRYLFDSTEGNQPLPYAIIVGVVLGNLTAEQGPTEFCAGYNRRFYDGLRCPEKPVAAAMSAGGAYLFDYSVLHRGPGNHDPLGRERPVRKDMTAICCLDMFVCVRVMQLSSCSNVDVVFPRVVFVGIDACVFAQLVFQRRGPCESWTPADSNYSPATILVRARSYPLFVCAVVSPRGSTSVPISLLLSHSHTHAREQRTQGAMDRAPGRPGAVLSLCSTK